jgi:hypothetical protein
MLCQENIGVFTFFDMCRVTVWDLCCSNVSIYVILAGVGFAHMVSCDSGIVSHV